MVIMHNMKAMNAERQMNVVTADKAKSTEKLSSGYRINRSADDAAGLSISEKMRHQIRGLDRGSANIEEGVGYCQVADGALNEMHDMLQRMNELCIQAANGTLSESDRGDIDDEVQQLKAELQRICDTTKFNEEYIFRCKDVIEEKPHDVYRLNFSGRPKDLFIYNTSYDPDTYAGVAFRGRRYTWDEISPGMYDEVNKEFREGEYGFRADDGTQLTLVCEKGAKLPQVSRLFETSADGRGIYVNGDLVSWKAIGPAVGQPYSFDYHGMTISFTMDAGDSYEDMLLKMTGTVWESTYEVPVASRSVDATFNYHTNPYHFMNNERIRSFLYDWGSRYMPKYIIHAEDIDNPTDKGKIPVWNDTQTRVIGYEDFDGVWLEGTDDDGTPNERVLKKMTWEEFGFNCGYHDWSNLNTDIWVGTTPKKTGTQDPVNYPPDATHSGTASNPGYYNFAEYDPYRLFDFINGNDQSEHFDFKFSVINEVSKEQVITALNNNADSNNGDTDYPVYSLIKDPSNPQKDGLVVYYPEITPDDRSVDKNVVSNANITYFDSTLGLTLRDEYDLGRNYQNGQASCMLKNFSQLQYANGRFSISYQYASDRPKKGGNMVLSGTPSVTNGLDYLEDLIIQKGTINGDRLNVTGDTIAEIIIGLSGGAGSGLRVDCNYNIKDFYGNGGAKIKATLNRTSGDYIRDGNKYVLYSSSNPNHAGMDRYDVSLTNASDQSLSAYFSNTVYKEIADAYQIRLDTDDYPVGRLVGEELPVSAMVTRWQTPFQHDHAVPLEGPKEKPEYLRIQCSSNTIDNIWIQKQKLSVYRMGLLNVGTLTGVQATGCIDIVGKAISQVSSIRSLFGAEQNRLEHAYDINRNTHENTQSAESKIRDTDMAKEMIKFSNANILEQSGNSMLVQANQANNMVLSLLQ